MNKLYRLYFRYIYIFLNILDMKYIYEYSKYEIHIFF